MATRVVVIGAGQAGLSLCAELRDLGHSGPITLVGEEAVPPYQRPPLSKAYLLGEMSQDRLFLRPDTFYEKQEIELRTATRIKAIDRAAQKIRTEADEEIPYDKLVLTTGARAIRLPAEIGGDLSGVLTMRNLADADALAEWVTPGLRVLVVGGGYIGLEAAAVMAKQGLSVTLVEAADRVLSRVASKDTSDFFRSLHQRHDVDIRESVQLNQLHGLDGKVRRALLSDGTEIDIDLVITGIGIRPNQELAAEAGLDIDNGIKVDAFCRTSDPAILAAGDCASFPWNSTRIRLESVGNAIDQAQAAAATIMGRGTRYTAKPWFWSDQYDTKLQIAGLSTGHNNVVARHNEKGAVSFWYYRDDALLAVDAMNDPRAYMVAKRLIDAGLSPAKEALTNPDVPLKSLLDT